MSNAALEFSKRGDAAFSRLAAKLPDAQRFRLLLEQRLDERAFAELRQGMSAYLSRVLDSPAQLSEEELCQGLLERKGRLANYSPGALLVPKWEQTLEFNQLHRALVRAFDGLGLGSLIESIDLPVNVRVVYGETSPSIAQQPYSSTKPHLDVWAGVPGDAVVVLIPVLGDIDNITVESGEIPPEHELSWMRVLPAYDGADVDYAVKYDGAPMRHGHIYLGDGRLFHQTVRRRHRGVRVSIDFRFRTDDLEYRALFPPISGGPESEVSRISYAAWQRVGRDELIVFPETMVEAAVSCGSVSSSPAYAPEYQLVRVRVESEKDDERDTTVAPLPPQELYDASAADWVRVEPVMLSDFTARPAVLELCKPLEGARVLDLGCGEGYCARQLARAGAGRVVGIDASSAMIGAAAAAEARQPNAIVYRQGDATDLSQLADESFDVVLAMFLFNYLSLSSLRACLGEVRRVLATGGRFVFAVPHPSYPLLSEPGASFGFDMEGAGYFSGRDRRFSGRIGKRDGSSLNVQLCHKTLEDYFDALSAAGLGRIQALRELGVTAELEELDPGFFGPLRDRPLHLAMVVTKG